MTPLEAATGAFPDPEESKYDMDTGDGRIRYRNAVLKVTYHREGYVKRMQEEGWISVEDRLPEPEEVVIVSGGIAHLRNGGWWTLTGVEYPGRPIQWTVTRWMPLPAPPVLPAPTPDDR